MLTTPEKLVLIYSLQLAKKKKTKRSDLLRRLCKNGLEKHEQMIREKERSRVISETTEGKKNREQRRGNKKERNEVMTTSGGGGHKQYKRRRSPSLSEARFVQASNKPWTISCKEFF